MYFKICFGFKECEDNYCGQNCRERCNETCRSCNKTTGVCDSGCYPGWRGLYCQQGKTFSLIMLKVTSTVTSRWKHFPVICPVNCGFSRQFRFFCQIANFNKRKSLIQSFCKRRLLWRVENFVDIKEKRIDKYKFWRHFNSDLKFNVTI